MEVPVLDGSWSKVSRTMLDLHRTWEREKNGKKENKREEKMKKKQKKQGDREKKRLREEGEE